MWSYVSGKILKILLFQNFYRELMLLYCSSGLVCFHVCMLQSDAMAAHGLVSHLPDAFKLKTDLKSAYKMITVSALVFTD